MRQVAAKDSYHGSLSVDICDYRPLSVLLEGIADPALPPRQVLHSHELVIQQSTREWSPAGSAWSSSVFGQVNSAPS